MPYQIGTLLVAGVMIIFTGGYYAYSNLTKMVRLLQQECAPHYGLVNIKDITASVEHAENNVRLYGITKQEIYLENYYEVIINLDSSIRILHTQYPDDMWFNSRIDTIELLADQMVQSWDELIVILNIGGRADIIANLEQELETPATESAEEKGILARIFNSDKKDKSHPYCELL